MTKQLLCSFALLLIGMSAIFAQPKLKNNRFGNIIPTEITLLDSGEFYSDPVLDKYNEELNQIFKAEDLVFIKAKAIEKMLPPAINSFEKRETNRPLMADYKLYELARVENGAMVICIAPLSENQHMKEKNMIGADDVILVFGAAAFGEAVAAAEDDDYSPAIEVEEEVLLRPDIDFDKVKVKNLTETMRLKMPEGEGSNAAAVVWQPDVEKYYASFAGNESYPLAVFDKKGNRVSADDLSAGFDVRGLWYDAKRGKILGNGYSEAGWFQLDLKKKPSAPEANNIKTGQLQPSEHAVGTWDAGDKSVVFLDAPTRSVVFYGDNFQEKKRLLLQPGITESANATVEAALTEDYNNTSLVASGGKKNAFGLYHYVDGQVEWYNRDGGLLTEVWKLPSDAPKFTSFNFSLANNVIWLFESETRTWIGYK